MNLIGKQGTKGKRKVEIIVTVVAIEKGGRNVCRSKAVVGEDLKEQGSMCPGFVVVLGREFEGSEVWIVL